VVLLIHQVMVQALYLRKIELWFMWE